MPVLMFQERFASLVESGQKRQTIRPRRKRPIKVGDAISLRKWSDKPYRSKQARLKEVECAETSSIEMTVYQLFVDGVEVKGDALEKFARADGFASAREMGTWFNKTHGLPFEGDLIQW